MPRANEPFPTIEEETDPISSQRLQEIFVDPAHQGLRNVQVSHESGRVCLAGTVSSYYLKQMAQEQVRQVYPHASLCNKLVVQRPS
ncbi:MAG: BON domain-containing protein [Planctomycetota bacterium]